MDHSVNIRTEYKQWIALFLGIFTILLFYFGEVLMQPNLYMLNAEGDGLKNYFTLVWYLEHDSGTHFTGMNYPYGEHIVYTDNQPALAFFLKFIHQNITPVSHLAVGIVNLLIFFSIFSCGILLYLILRKFLLEPWFALGFALLICFMSPQLRRMTGHYSLAYCAYIPLLWYMLLRFMEKRQVFMQAIWLIATITFFSFIHLYYLLIGTLVVLAYTLVWAVRRRKNLPKKRFVYLALIALLPLLTTTVFISITDTITDRPAAPGGFFHYRAFFKSIFIPVSGTIQEFIDKNIFTTSHRFESQAYIGFIAFLAVIFSVVKFLRKGIANKFQQFPRHILSTRMKDWTWAGTLVLLFATAFPFTLGMAFLLDYLPGLRQFRSLGRFAWVFYYIIGVYAAYLCFLVYRRLRIDGKQRIAVVLLALVLFIWGAEDYFFLEAINPPISKNVLLDSENQLKEKLEEEGYITDEFQALMILPFYQIGSEKTHIDPYWKSFKTSVGAAYELGLPLAQGNLSRTSISQTLKLCQQVSHPIIKREILQDLPNEKPYLVIAFEDELNTNEQNILKKGKLIFAHNKLTVYELPLSAFKNNYNTIWQDYRQGNLVEYNGILTNKITKAVVIDELESKGSNLFFKGIERRQTKETILELYDDRPVLDTNHESYEASVWFYADPNYSAYPTFIMEQTTEEGEISRQEISSKDNTQITEGWIRASVDFNYIKSGNIRFYLSGQGIAAASFVIRPKGVSIYQELEKAKTLNFNNYFINNE